MARVLGPPVGPYFDFAWRFRRACDRKFPDRNQVELGKIFGIGRSAINDWRHGRKLPAAKTAIRMAKILNVSFDWLMTGRGDESPIPAADSLKTAQQIERLDRDSRQILKAAISAIAGKRD